MRFRSREDLAELSDAEYEALGSLHFAVNDLRHEWLASHTVLDRLSALGDHASHIDDNARFEHRSDALSQMSDAAYEYSRALELVMWRYVSAYALLGITLLNRVATGYPALEDDAVHALTSEPTLGALQTALSVPVASLLRTRDDFSREFAEEQQENLQRGLKGIVENLADPYRQKPLDQEQAVVCRLTEADDPAIDPLWDGVLKPLLEFGEQNVLQIGSYSRQQS